jgi:hypothetical protein
MQPNGLDIKNGSSACIEKVGHSSSRNGFSLSVKCLLAKRSAAYLEGTTKRILRIALGAIKE